MLTEVRSSPVMNRLVIRRDLWRALALAVLGLCLFADCTPLKNTHILAPALAEIAAVLGDPGTQGMVFVLAGIYFLGFVILGIRLSESGIATAPANRSTLAEVLLVGTIGMAAAAYAFCYTEAVRSTQALTLLGPAMLGKERHTGNAEGRMQNVEKGTPEVQNPMSNVQCLWWAR